MRKKLLFLTGRTMMFVWTAIFGLAALSGTFGLPAQIERELYSPSEPGVNDAKTIDVTGIKTRIRLILEQTLDIGEKKAFVNSTTLNVKVDKRNVKCESPQCTNCLSGQCNCAGGQCVCPTGCQDNKANETDVAVPVVSRIEREVEQKQKVESTTKDTQGEDDDEEDNPKNETMLESDDIMGGYEAMLNRERQLYVRSISELPEQKDHKDVVKPDVPEPDDWERAVRNESALREVKPSFPEDGDFSYPKMNEVRLRREAGKTEKPNESLVKNDAVPDTVNQTDNGLSSKGAPGVSVEDQPNDSADKVDKSSSRVKRDSDKAVSVTDKEPEISTEVAEISEPVQNASKIVTPEVNSSPNGKKVARSSTNLKDNVLKDLAKRFTKSEDANLEEISGNKTSAAQELQPSPAKQPDATEPVVYLLRDMDTIVKREIGPASTRKAAETSPTDTQSEISSTEEVAKVSVSVQDGSMNTHNSSSGHENGTVEKKVATEIKETEPAKVSMKVREVASGEESTKMNKPEEATLEVSDAPIKDNSSSPDHENGSSAVQTEQIETNKKLDEPAAKKVRELPIGEQLTKSKEVSEAPIMDNSSSDHENGSKTDEKSIETEMGQKPEEPSKISKQVRELPSVKLSTNSNKQGEATIKEVSDKPIDNQSTDKAEKDSNLGSNKPTTPDNRKNAPTVAEPEGDNAKKRLESGLESSWGSDTQDADLWQKERRLGEGSEESSDSDPSRSVGFNNLDIRYLGGNDLNIPAVDANNFHPESVNEQNSDQTPAHPVPGKPLAEETPSSSNQIAPCAFFVTSFAFSATGFKLIA